MLLGSCVPEVLEGASGEVAATDGGVPADVAIGVSDAAADPPAAVLVWTPDATGMVAELRAPGHVPAPPAGSVCYGQATYTFTVADRGLAWRVCRGASRNDYSTAWRFFDGQRTLSDEESGRLVSALRMVQKDGGQSCGADGAGYALAVTTPAGTIQYEDGFYACQRPGNWIRFTIFVLEELERLVP